MFYKVLFGFDIFILVAGYLMIYLGSDTNDSYAMGLAAYIFVLVPIVAVFNIAMLGVHWIFDR